jgi:hypothetical protein
MTSPDKEHPVIPDDIDRIATDIVRADYSNDAEPDYGIYLAISLAILAERQRWQQSLPADIIESLLKVGRVEWGVSPMQSDEEHISDLRNTLNLTRKYFEMTEAETQIHGVYLEGQGVIVAHTGTSPNSPQHARILSGAWNQLVDLAEAVQTSTQPTKTGD